MEVTEALSIILYVLGSTLLVVLIILGIKLIIAVNKVNSVVDDVNKKVSSLNGLFAMIDMTTDKLALLSDRMVDGITFIIKKLFKTKRKEEDTNE